MVKHIVLWKVKDSAEKQQNIERMTTMLNALVGKIEGLVSVELGYNFNTSSDYDVVLYATLKSASALRRYQNHPEHVKCKDFIGSITESRVAADYFYDEETAAAPPYIEDEDIPAETQAAPKPEAPKGPEITVEFPPKREILPAPSIPKAAPVSAPADSAAFSEDKLYDPAFAPEIVVRRPPLWEAEVIPAKNGTVAVTRAADEKTAPVDPFAAESSFAEPVSLFADEPASKPAPKKKFPSPAPKAAPTRTAATPKATPANAQVNPVSTEHSKITEKTNAFGKKKLDVQVTPLDQRSDTWTCPNCGKIMPNYVGTCGCGEPKPFEFEPPMPFDADTAPLPDIKPAEKPKSKLSKEQMDTFENVVPSIQGYNPQVKQDIPETQDNTYDFIQNDTTVNNTDPNYQPPDLSFIQQQDETFNNDATNSFDGTQDFNAPLDPFNFDQAPEAAPMRFDDLPPAAPMRFSDTPPAFLGIDNTPPAAPAAPKQPEKPVIPEYQRAPVEDFSTAKSRGVKEKKPKFMSKKAKEAEVFRKAQEAVNNRKDVPNNGTWTCPNCGKVMPQYVGTCGCGEPKPFEF